MILMHKKAQSLCNFAPELQKYASIPPGIGWGVVYAVVNVDNGKAYIGKHSHGVTPRSVKVTRWASHIKNHSPSMPIARAIQKYGVCRFAFVVLARVPEEEINEAEFEFIHDWDCIAPDGYNVAEGGNGCHFSEEQRVRLSDAQTKSYKDAKRMQKHIDSKKNDSAARREASSSKLESAIRKADSKKHDGMRRAKEQQERQNAARLAEMQKWRELDPERARWKSLENARKHGLLPQEVVNAGNAVRLNRPEISVWKEKQNIKLATLAGEELEKYKGQLRRDHKAHAGNNAMLDELRKTSPDALMSDVLRMRKQKLLTDAMLSARDGALAGLE